MKTHRYVASFVTQKLASPFRESDFYCLLLLTILTLGYLVVVQISPSLTSVRGYGKNQEKIAFTSCLNSRVVLPAEYQKRDLQTFIHQS